MAVYGLAGKDPCRPSHSISHLCTAFALVHSDEFQLLQQVYEQSSAGLTDDPFKRGTLCLIGD
jgi:hypothetical protein